MPTNSPKQIPFEYGFPLFVPSVPKTYLVKLPKIRVSDIWGFWDYLVKMQTLKRGRISGDFLPTLLEQSKYFYEAAQNAPMKSQPLLYYYSFLNLAKIVININWPYGNATEYYHGIETKVNAATTLDTAEMTFKNYGGTGSSRISVAKEFFMYMGDTVAVPGNTLVKKLLASCVGIHRTYSETFGLHETFHRLDNCSYIEKEGKIITYLSPINKINSATMANLIAARGYNIAQNVKEEKTTFVYSESFHMADYNVAKIRWKMLADQIIQKGIWSYTDGNEYRLYISSDAIQWSSPSIIYSIMFFFGSITRYHPYFFESILNAKEQWLISEFMRTQPMQFLYYVTSKVVGNYIYKSRTDKL